MTLSLKHTFVSPVSDNADPNQVQPSHWNGEHTFTMATARMLGRTTAGDGAVEELTDAAVKTFLALDNVNNTSDANKPVSTAQQAALNLKADIASPTFTGTVGGITKSMVGLGNVDNTSDADKPISTATQTALDDKQEMGDNYADYGIVSGAITITYFGAISVDTEGLASTDLLFNIYGGVDGAIIRLTTNTSVRDVTVKDGTAGGQNLALNSDFTLTSPYDSITLMWDARLALWVELARSDNA